MTTYRFKAVRARQAPGHDVFVFAAHPSDVLSFAAIERVARALGEAFERLILSKKA